MKAHTFGRIVVTVCNQAAGAPLIDRGHTRETVSPFREFKSIVILLTPWRRNEWKESRPQKALVLGWQR